MRFEELTIEKFGVYNNLTLSLAQMPGLAVIYGPNEAGKTTCLAAITDFLFGIPLTSPHGHVFGYDQIKLRASLRLSNGKGLILCRRKGRKTLSDQDNKNVDESVLSTWLGAISRTRFEALFGLGHESLREGGQQLLDAEGDIGRLIVEAGGGLRSVVQSLEKLGIEADGLFSTRRAAERAFYKALDRFEAAEKEIKQNLLTRETYDQARDLHKTSKEKIEQLRAQRRDLSERLLRQRRLVRVIPVLIEIERIEESISSFVDLDHLKDDFGTRVSNALATLEATSKTFAEAENKRSDLEKQINELPVSSTLSQAEALIRDITEKAVHVSKEKLDRPKRDSELLDRQEKLSLLKQRVGAKADKDLEALMPSQPTLDRVQALVVEGLDLRPKIESLKDQIESDVETIARLEIRQRDREEKGFDKPSGISIADFAQLPSLAVTLETKRKQADRLEAEITKRLKTIGFQTVNEAQSFPCPDAACIQAEIDRNAVLEQLRIKQVENIATQTANLSVASAEIERLKKAGEVPTDTVVSNARQERQGGWLPIREAYLAEEDDGVRQLPVAERLEAANNFEEQIEKADRLADRKSIEAQRIAALELAEKQQSEAMASLAALVKAGQETETKIAEARRSWADSWPQAVNMGSDLTRFKVIVKERESILGLVDNFQEIRDEIERLDADFAARLETVALAEQRSGATPDSKASFASRIQAATQAVMVHDNAYADFRSDLNAIMTTKDQLERKRVALNNLKNNDAIWRNEWKQDICGIGLSEGCSLEHANEVVTLWAAAGGILDGIQLTRTRLEHMGDDECNLKSLIDKAAVQINFELPTDPIAAARMLKEKWESNNKLYIERSGLMAQLSGLASERDRSQGLLNQAHEAIAALGVEAGCEETDLRSIAERQALYLENRKNRLQFLDTLHSTGDGIAVAILREQWGGRDIAAINAEINEMEDQDRSLENAIEEAAGNLRDRERDLERFGSEEGISRSVADRERAGAELRQITEDYLEVALARELLSRAIDQLRHQQQDPLITRAGDLFSMTTSGDFVAIETDVDDKGRPVVVGKRSSGETVSIATMSDGTRDQLFLAFRLAAIEHYCASAEPLPFIADDLLVHFDDKRSKATLKLLAEFGKRTQVLLFTHHESILDAAKELMVAGSAGICELA